MGAACADVEDAGLPLPEGARTDRAASRSSAATPSSTRCSRLWRRAVDGQHSLVLLSGEPGIGKTRLSSELARRAHAQGLTVLYGRCDDELGVPYQPFVEALSFVVDNFEPTGLPRRCSGATPAS